MQSLSPLVSVITPVYRCADVLPTALRSLIGQDETRWESIVVDDGSPDNSYKVARHFAWGDSRFHVLAQSNGGACAARNAGLRVARGKYVLFLDADDWMEPGALGAMVGVCERKHWAAVHGLFCYAKPDGTPTQWIGGHSSNASLFETLASSNVLSVPSCVLLQRSMLEELGHGFDTLLAHCGDWDLWARLARADCKIGHLDECVTGYRMRPTSLSRNPLTLLRDARTVLSRIHSPDPRVRHPNRRHTSGANSDAMQARVGGITCYAASLAAMQGRIEDAQRALNMLSPWPVLEPGRIAEFLLHAACMFHCASPDDLRPLPLPVRETTRRIAITLEDCSRSPGLANDVINALSDLGFDFDAEIARMADRARLQRPRTASDTVPVEYLRSLALQERLAG